MPRSFPILALLSLSSLATAANAQQWTAEKIIGELNKKRSRPRIVTMSVVQKIRTLDPEKPSKWLESTESGDITIDFPKERYRFELQKQIDGHIEHRTRIYDGKELKGRRWLTDLEGNRIDPENETVGIGTGQFRHAIFSVYDFPFALMFGGILPESSQYYPGHIFFPLDDKLFTVNRVETLNARQIVAIRTFPAGSGESRIFNEYLIDPAADYGIIKMTQYRSMKADTRNQTVYELSFELQKIGTTYLPKSWIMRVFSGNDKETSRRECTVTKTDVNVTESILLFDIPIKENQKVVRQVYAPNKNNDSSIIQSKETVTMVDGQLTSERSSKHLRWILVGIVVIAFTAVVVMVRRQREINRSKGTPENNSP
jgi:hypothetical protein